LIGDVWLVIRREKGYVFTIVAGELISDTTTVPKLNSTRCLATTPASTVRLFYIRGDDIRKDYLVISEIKWNSAILVISSVSTRTVPIDYNYL